MPMPTHTQALHWQLLRLTKGAVRAWEVWLRAETGTNSVIFTPHKDDAAEHPKPVA